MASLPDRLILAYQQYRDRDLVTAQQTCQALLEQAPDHPEALALMGCIWHGLGHNDRAEACWRQTIALKPDYAEAHNNLGAVLQGRGDLEGAITHYQQAITHHPAYAEAYCNLGNALQLQEQLEAAIAHYQRAIQLKPDYAEAHSNLGTAYQRQKQFDAAIAHYQQALALRSDYPETHYNWGRLLEEQENFAEAESHYHQAIALKPNYAAAHNQLGYRQQQRHAYAEAEYHYRQAIAFGFESVDTLHCLAVVLHNQGKYEAAIAQYQATIARKPDHSHAHLNMAIAYLTVGDFATGWREYEWRWQVPEFQGLVFSAHPRWDGSDLNGQTILLHSEQGLGDTIQFVRYAPLVAQRGGTVLVSCPESLRRLFATVPGVSQVVERFVPNHRFQTYAALMSLPYLLGTTVDTIPANVPYLRVSTPPPLTLTAPPTCRLKVGLMWSGNPANGQNFRRSCPLAALAPLWQLTDIAFYSLQKELSPADQAAIATLPIQDLSPYLGDFADTAALIDQLDWVISVDTSVAHLAGAMAKPVWLLLADVADWRWLLDREDSPWYPTMRIFRQSKAGDWDNVIARVVQALKQELLLWGGREEKREKRKEKREEQEPSPEYVNHKTNQLSALASLPSPLTSLKIQTSKLLAQQGLDCLKAQQWESAIAYYQQALPDYPQPAEIHFHLGYAYHQLGDENRAMEQYQRALSLHPDYPEALCNLGNLMQARQQWETAINYYHRVLSLVPNYVDAHNNLGTALFNQGKITAAIEHYQQALKVKPDHLDARYNLGNAYVKQGNLTAASAQYQQVLAQNPNHIGAAHNLGSCLFKQGEIAAAIAYFQQVIALDPNHVDAHCNLSIAWLIQGDFRRGFGEYEWRWRTQHFAKTPPTQPQWDGSDLAGRRILLHPEQGYGDLIQFIRYAPLVAARGGRVIVCCPDNLQRLFATVPGIDRVLNMAISQQDFDICAPLLSLPRLLGTTLETIPATVPYLHAPPDSPLQLKAPRGTRLKVGLVWAGSPEHPNDAQRSCGLRVLWPLLALADIAFYSLQVGAPALELAELPEVYRARVTDLSPQLTDFWETAAAIKQLDLVITVDTSVAHLAGALAKPVWVLLSYLPDWRWLIDREDSPWYPTARLFRQPHPGNWEQVITQVSVALQAYANTKPDHLRKGFIAAAAKTQSQKQKKQSKRSRPKTVTQIIPESTAQKLAKKEERGERREERGEVSSSLFPLPSSLAEEERAERSNIASITSEQRQTLERLMRQGTQALEKQDWSAAIAAYQQAIALNPNLPRTLSNLGVALHKTGDLDAAITYYQAALRQKPDFPEAHYNLGKALQEKGNFDAASDHYRRAIALNPTYAEPYYGLGSILAQSDTWDKLFTPQDHFEAIKSCYEQLLRVRPQEAAAYNNLGSAYFRRGKIAESVTYFEQAIAHDPHLSPAHRNLGLALLTQGDLVRGFAEYRWRWQVEGQGLPNFSQPQWDGSDLTGKTILLYPEQGHGDIIQFVRYAPLVAQRGGRVVVSCYAGLERLVASVAGVDQVVTHHKKVDFDTFFPLMDLPIIFKTDLATVPAQIPYLKAPAIPPLILQVPDHIRLKVGIVWAGNPQNPTDQKRSCPLIAFLPLLALKNIAFYSLQVGEPVTQLANLPDEIALLDLSPHLKDFADTAAVIEQLDLVITVDTAVAHLAGALGKSTWILLSALPDWRWLLDREDSPWYPTVRLFRQTRLGDWAEVMTRVVDTLAELRDTYTQPHPSKQVATIIAALTKQGNTYLKNKQWDAAITCFKKAIALQPNLPTVHYSLGWLYKQKLDLEWAEQYLRQAIALAPDLAEAHFTLGTTLLLRGDWLSGWEEYEWRFKTALFQKLSTAFLNVNKTCLTDRENIAGKRILICKEQGFGDQIQFFRYALLIGRLGGTAISVCSTELKSLFERAIYIVEPARADANIIVTDQPSIPISDFDEYISLMSLPKLFGTTPDSIPLPVPYLFAPEISSIHLKTTSLTLKIGIAWAGSSLNQENDKRSCTLTDLLSLLNLKNIDFYSLQVGPESQQLESLPPTVTVYDLSPQLQDFADTAAAIEQLDLVISVDTAVAHLTGAMAKPVWVLLAHLPDWRWLLDRDDSPWYPTMRLFRQTKPGDWASVMQRVKTALQEFLVQNSKFKIQSSLENTNSQTSIVIQPKVFEPSPSFTARCQPVTTIPETKIPKQLAIDWSMQLTSGWGVYGFNLALQLLRYKSCQPIALRPPLVCLEDLNPLYQRLLLPYFQSYQNIEQITSQHPGQTIGLGMPVLQALGNNFVGADRLQAFRGDRTIGVIFFENTHFTADALAIAQQYDWIIAGSHWNEAILRQHGLTRVSTVLQGIDPTYFHPAPRLHLFPDRFVIFSGGKLEYRKGQDIIVAAFKHFQQRHPDTLLITAWQTHWPQYMRGMEQTGNVIGLPEMGANRQLGIVPWLVRNGIPAEAVIDLGRVPNHQMPQILREADVAVFTNRAEGGTNLVAMECLATGLPTILSANTGHLDLIREDLQLDHCYVLRSQGPVRPNAHFPAVDGWGESAVEEVIAHLEAVYQNRAVAKGKGERAVQFMHILTWETQVQGLLATLSHLYP